MRRVILAFFLAVLLLIPNVPVSAGQTPQNAEQEIRKAIQEYFNLRMEVLSTLVFDEKIKTFLAPSVAGSKDAISESDVLDAMVQYRKSQVNDLRFSKYTMESVTVSVVVRDNKAWVSAKEIYTLYFNCAPTVKNQASVEHTMAFGKYGSRWLIVKDDYNDPEGVRKKLYGTFSQNGVTITDAVKMLVSESENHLTGRMARLQKLMEDAGEKDLMVFYAGLPVAFAGGKAVRLDREGTAAPVFLDGNVYLPVRYIAENSGAQVGWEADTATVKIALNGSEFSFRIGDKKISGNSAALEMNSPARLFGGKVMLPVEGLAGILGKKSILFNRKLVVLGDRNQDAQKQSTLYKDLDEFFGVILSKPDFPRIDGSTATYPLSMEIGKELLGLDDTSVKGFITHQTTHNAYVNLVNGSADIIFVTQPSPDEYALAKQKGVELEVVPICKEGFVFLANKENTMTSLTVKQVQDIYQGKITNWKAVGGAGQ